MRLEGEYYRWSDADNMGTEIDFETFLTKCGVWKKTDMTQKHDMLVRKVAYRQVGHC